MSDLPHFPPDPRRGESEITHGEKVTRETVLMFRRVYLRNCPLHSGMWDIADKRKRSAR